MIPCLNRDRPHVLYTVKYYSTLSLLGYLKTRICSKSHVWCPNMTNDTSLGISCEYAKKICKILNNLIFNQEKLKNCKFPSTYCLQKISNFFFKTCAICFLMSKAFQKAKFFQNLTCGSVSKQRFSLLQEKAVIQAVCLRTQAVSIKSRV